MDAITIPTDGNEKSIHSVETIDSNKSLSRSTESFSFELYDTLVEHCQSNIQYFERDTNNTVTSKRFLDAFCNILHYIEIIRQYITEFHGFWHEYDFDDVTPANGYRSIEKVTNEYIKHTIKVSKYIAGNRGNLLFRKRTYAKEIETSSQALASLCSIFDQAKKVKEKCDHGSLIPAGEHKASGLFDISNSIDQHPFYGRCIGLHYCSSLQLSAKYVGVVMAGFSEMFYNKRSNRILKTTTSIYRGNKYNRNPELRAKRILELSLFSRVEFNQAFLSLTEAKLLHAPSNMFNAKIKVNRMLTIPSEPLDVENANECDKMVQIPIPSSHLGVRPITVRLLSNVRREGMEFKRNQHRIHPMSNSLVFHCHGGGFVAHTSKSHEIYLRGWAAELHVPILSVDYSLAPQAPYPRALEDIFYAYCWAIKNAKLLGTTAERIVVVGDSAGAVLNMALTLKCIEQSVRRPDGALLIYPPLIIGFDPSASRILCTIDVMLPHGFLMGYLKAYLHPDEDQCARDASTTNSELSDCPTTSRNPRKNDRNPASHKKSTRNRLSTNRNPVDDYRFDIPRDPFISPLYASDEMLKQMPPIKILTLDHCPFLDESITMAKKLGALGKSVGLDVLPGLPHGFLHFVHVSKDANDANRLCIARLVEMLGKTEVASSMNDISENV